MHEHFMSYLGSLEIVILDNFGKLSGDSSNVVSYC